MKKIIVFCLFFCFTGQIFACEKPQIKYEKRYIDFSQVRFCENGIFVDIDNNFIKIDNLRFDNNGYYIRLVGLGEDYGLTWWKCPDCENKNSVYYGTCQNEDCPSKNSETDDNDNSEENDQE